MMLFKTNIYIYIYIYIYITGRNNCDFLMEFIITLKCLKKSKLIICATISFVPSAGDSILDLYTILDVN